MGSTGIIIKNYYIGGKSIVSGSVIVFQSFLLEVRHECTHPFVNVVTSTASYSLTSVDLSGQILAVSPFLFANHPSAPSSSCFRYEWRMSDGLTLADSTNVPPILIFGDGTLTLFPSGTTPTFTGSLSSIYLLKLYAINRVDPT